METKKKNKIEILNGCDMEEEVPMRTNYREVHFSFRD